MMTVGPSAGAAVAVASGTGVAVAASVAVASGDGAVVGVGAGVSLGTGLGVAATVGGAAGGAVGDAARVTIAMPASIVGVIVIPGVGVIRKAPGSVGRNSSTGAEQPITSAMTQPKVTSPFHTNTQRLSDVRPYAVMISPAARGAATGADSAGSRCMVGDAARTMQRAKTSGSSGVGVGTTGVGEAAGVSRDPGVAAEPVAAGEGEASA